MRAEPYPAASGSWCCEAGSLRDYEAWHLQEAAEIIPTLDQLRGDVIGARVQERLRTLVRERRRCPSSHHDSQLWQCRAKFPDKIPCFRCRAGREISEAHDRELSV